MFNLMGLDDGGRLNIAYNTYKRNSWSRFTIKQRISLYIYFAQLNHHQENTDIDDVQKVLLYFMTSQPSLPCLLKVIVYHISLYSPDNALIFRNIYKDSLNIYL